MDTDTALTVLSLLDDAEQALSRMRLHQPGCGRAVLQAQRHLLEEAKHHLSTAHSFAGEEAFAPA